MAVVTVVAVVVVVVAPLGGCGGSRLAAVLVVGWASQVSGWHQRVLGDVAFARSWAENRPCVVGHGCGFNCSLSGDLVVAWWSVLGSSGSGGRTWGYPGCGGSC